MPLTTQLHGKNEEVKNWIAKQKLKDINLLWVDRPDINDAASQLFLKLLPILRGEIGSGEEATLQSSLRLAYKENWLSFTSSKLVQTKKVMRRAEVVEDAMSRIKYTESGMAGPPRSPMMLSSVSSSMYNLSTHTPYAPARHSSINSAPPTPTSIRAPPFIQILVEAAI